jgi:hypothetical protein
MMCSVLEQGLYVHLFRHDGWEMKEIHWDVTTMQRHQLAVGTGQGRVV